MFLIEEVTSLRGGLLLHRGLHTKSLDFNCFLDTLNILKLGKYKLWSNKLKDNHNMKEICRIHGENVLYQFSAFDRVLIVNRVCVLD